MTSIEIDKEAVYDEVKLMAAYIGAKGGEYEKSSMVEGDRKVLDSFWGEGLCDIAEALSPAGAVASGDESKLRLSLPIAGTLADTLKAIIKKVLISVILSKWLSLIGHGQAGERQERASELIAKAKSLVMAEPKALHRPFRREIPPM